MFRALSISTACLLALASADIAEAKISKKFVRGMDDVAADLKLSSDQQNCISTPIYEELGKTDAKEFVKVVEALKDSGMYNPGNVADDVTSAVQVKMFDDLTTAYVGLILLGKGFSVENLKYSKQMSAAKVRIADECVSVFPGADMSLLRPSTDGE